MQFSLCCTRLTGLDGWFALQPASEQYTDKFQGMTGRKVVKFGLKQSPHEIERNAKMNTFFCYYSNRRILLINITIIKQTIAAQLPI